MKNIIQVTQIRQNTEKTIVLIGVESIIKVEPKTITYSNGTQQMCTEISSRGAMVTTTYVSESVEEIFAKINQ